MLAYLTWVIERLGTWKEVFNLPVGEITREAYKRLGEKAARAAWGHTCFSHGEPAATSGLA